VITPLPFLEDRVDEPLILELKQRLHQHRPKLTRQRVAEQKPDLAAQFPDDQL